MMEGERKEQKEPSRGAIVGRCPTCKGTGKVPKKLPFLANPKAPATRADKLGLQICPQCRGTGRVRVE